jgi:SNF2-related domain
MLKFNVLVTTYDDLIRDVDELSEVAWRSVVVDEAHRLRNQNSRLLECLRTIMMRGEMCSTALHVYYCCIQVSYTTLCVILAYVLLYICRGGVAQRGGGRGPPPAHHHAAR